MDDMTGIFRTAAFGGFNKDDVLGFIESQKKVEADLRAAADTLDRKLREATAGIETLTAEKTALEEEIAASGDVRETASALAIKEAEYHALEEKYHALIQRAEALEQELAEKREAQEDSAQGQAAAAFAEKEAECRALMAEKTALAEKNTSLAAEKDALVAEKDALSEEIAALKKQNGELAQQFAAQQAKPEKSIEEQVGTCFVDARRFADQIIGEARGQQALVQSKTLEAVSCVDRRAENVAGEVQLFREKCTRLFDDIDAQLASLRGDLQSIAGEIG